MGDIAEGDAAGQKATESGRLRWQLPNEDDATAAQDGFRGQESEPIATGPSALQRFRYAASAVAGEAARRNGGIASEGETNGEASAVIGTEPSISIQKLREVANTLAAEAIRRRRGLSEFALNQALSNLPSIWSHDEAQARSFTQA
jgi:hypothetical protein